MPSTRVLRVGSEAAQDAVTEAAAVLRAHGLVAFPTETFYGLGAAALDPMAVARLLEAKGRPEGKPLLVLVDSLAMVGVVAEEIPPVARELMSRHWPGPLTLVLRARPCVPDAVTAGTGTIGVRLSADPLACRLVTALGQPVTAPSANVSGQPPPTTAAAVLAQLDGRIELVLDGGSTPGGPASTVLDATVQPPRVLREGAVRL
ncbi:MAG TPA: L-threonylcarbamoyladenylate synthase [Methylomirabilota bacterium]|nr:L-threonylcarbamoyladenylate synthase [Methylomirabilota bacterium]HEV8616994.1 L-threonylcarbamoyladenylate synthase [Methylomirabilota bacterium]